MPDEYDVNDQDVDLLGELLGSEEDAPLPTDVDVKALQEQLASKDKEIQGLLTATKEERRKRQDTASKLNQLTDTVNGILSQRQQQGMESLTVSETADAKSQGIPVRYDEEGNAWVDDSAMNEMLSPYQQKINELEEKLQLTSTASAAADQAEKVKLSIIGEDERYASAAGRYRAARKWVEDQVVAYARANGAQRALTSGEALNYVFDDTLTNEFSQQFEGMNIIDIVTAEDSEPHFRRALSSIADAMSASDTQPKAMDSRFQKVLQKPSALGTQANAKAGQLSIFEKVGNLKSQDILDLSDEQIDTLMKAMSREEREDGIK